MNRVSALGLRQMETTHGPSMHLPVWLYCKGTYQEVCYLPSNPHPPVLHDKCHWPRISKAVDGICGIFETQIGQGQPLRDGQTGEQCCANVQIDQFILRIRTIQ